MPFWSLTHAQPAALLDANEASSASGSGDGAADSDRATAGRSENIPLSSIKAVAVHLPFVDAARAKVTTDMEAMVFTGLATLVSILNDFSSVVLYPAGH